MYLHSPLIFLLSTLGILITVGIAHADLVTTSVTVIGGNFTSAIVQYVIPERRYNQNQNLDVPFYLTVRTADDDDDTILFSQNYIAHTNSDGKFTDVPIDLLGIEPGVYDIGVKGASHLTRKLNDVTITAGTNTLNFSQPDNSAGLGAITLISGDINGDGSDPTQLGDDVVNSVDLSILLSQIDLYDPTGNTYRANLNQDDAVNSIDLSILLFNLEKEGDK